MQKRKEQGETATSNLHCQLGKSRFDQRAKRAKENDSSDVLICLLQVDTQCSHLVTAGVSKSTPSQARKVSKHVQEHAELLSLTNWFSPTRFDWSHKTQLDFQLWIPRKLLDPTRPLTNKTSCHLVPVLYLRIVKPFYIGRTIVYAP